MFSKYVVMPPDIFSFTYSLLDELALDGSNVSGLSASLTEPVDYTWVVVAAAVNGLAFVVNIFLTLNKSKKLKVETKYLSDQTQALAEQLKHTDRAFIEQINRIRRTEISKQLQEFLAPLKSLRTQSYKLYQVFAIEEKKQCLIARGKLKGAYKSEGKRFNRSSLTRDEVDKCYFGAVRFFVKGHVFEKRDLEVFDQILKVSDQIVELISEKSYLPRNPALTEILGEYLAHIDATKLARKGQLLGVYELEKLSMPLELDGAIESEIMRLEKEYQYLLPSNSSKTVDAVTENKSIAYYDEKADEYYRKTHRIDMREVYQTFKEALPSEAQPFILDAGCGPGRDTRYFIKSGFRVKSFDASEQMVRYCNMYPFAFCGQRTFSDVNELEAFHGVWACASLLNLDKDDFYDALTKLVYALKPLGALYFSIKSQPEVENHSKDGREFFYYTREEVESFLEVLGMERISIWNNHGKKEGNPTEFVNFLYKKPRITQSSDSRTRIS